jgi:hypothetical protein
VISRPNPTQITQAPPENRQKLPVSANVASFIASRGNQGSRKLELPEISSERKLRQELPMEWQ